MDYLEDGQIHVLTRVIQHRDNGRRQFKKMGNTVSIQPGSILVYTHFKVRHLTETLPNLSSPSFAKISSKQKCSFQTLYIHLPNE